MINQAIIFATNAHKGQVRKVKHTPFILHPLAVGCLLADAGEAEAVIVAGMLYDTVEDTDVTMSEIEEVFGEEVRTIVEGAVKIRPCRGKSGSIKQSLIWKRRLKRFEIGRASCRESA